MEPVSGFSCMRHEKILITDTANMCDWCLTTYLLFLTDFCNNVFSFFLSFQCYIFRSLCFLVFLLSFHFFFFWMLHFFFILFRFLFSCNSFTLVLEFLLFRTMKNLRNNHTFAKTKKGIYHRPQRCSACWSKYYFKDQHFTAYSQQSIEYSDYFRQRNSDSFVLLLSVYQYHKRGTD